MEDSPWNREERYNFSATLSVEGRKSEKEQMAIKSDAALSLSKREADEVFIGM